MPPIGKTRQPSKLPKRTAPQAEEVFDPDVGRARGVLMPPPAEGRMRHARRRPPDDLANWIEHFWSVSWSLDRGETFLQETLPHPNVHIVFEPDRSGIAGVHTARFSRILEGESRVFGIKFRAGGFRPFLGSSVSALANRIVPLEQVFGNDAVQWQATMLASPDETTQITAAGSFLREHLPAPDPNVTLASQLVDQILQTSNGGDGIQTVGIRTVEELARRNGIGQRSLQRLFQEYVGASPKWVIRRYRLHELVERLKAGDVVDGAQAALDLGYFDQAHLINDFRSIVGYSPSIYGNLLRSV
jgi:AraC-like DNA-binding protein